MSEWQHGRRQYGPHCVGDVGASSVSARTMWRVLFSQRVGTTTVSLSAGTLADDEPAAQAACDEQVAAWQAEFPWEIVTHE